MKFVVTLTALLAFSTGVNATCQHVSTALFGFSIGTRLDSYVENLRPGIRREGTAQFISEVGFESLDGTSEGMTFDRIMAFFDRGRFTGVVAVGSIPGAMDHGFQAIVSRVAEASGTAPTLAAGRATFACNDNFELYVEPAKWDTGPKIKISLTDRAAMEEAQRYLKEYCADPAKRRPQDACKP